MRPIWMNDPSISDIPEEKISFLSNMFDQIKNKNKNELMPFLMAMSKNKKQNLSFTPDEMNRIIAAIKNASSTEEQAKINKVLEMAHKKTDH